MVWSDLIKVQAMALWPSGAVGRSQIKQKHAVSCCEIEITLCMVGLGKIGQLCCILSRATPGTSASLLYFIQVETGLWHVFKTHGSWNKIQTVNSRNREV